MSKEIAKRILEAAVTATLIKIGEKVVERVDAKSKKRQEVKESKEAKA